MNSKIAIYSVFAIGAMALFGATLAVTFAASPSQDFSQRLGMGNRPSNGIGFNQMMESKADALGMSVDEVKAMRDEGKMFHEILEDKGIDMDAFHDKMMVNHEEFLQEQVAAGNITQEQADERLEWMEKRHAEGPQEDGARRGGMHQRKGRGFSQK